MHKFHNAKTMFLYLCSLYSAGRYVADNASGCVWTSEIDSKPRAYGCRRAWDNRYPAAGAHVQYFGHVQMFA